MIGPVSWTLAIAIIVHGFERGGSFRGFPSREQCETIGKALADDAHDRDRGLVWRCVPSRKVRE